MRINDGLIYWRLYASLGLIELIYALQATPTPVLILDCHEALYSLNCENKFEFCNLPCHNVWHLHDTLLLGSERRPFLMLKSRDITHILHDIFIITIIILCYSVIYIYIYICVCVYREVDKSVSLQRCNAFLLQRCSAGKSIYNIYIYIYIYIWWIQGYRMQ